MRVNPCLYQRSMSTLLRRNISKRSGRAGIGKILFILAILITVAIASCTTFVVMSLRTENLGTKLGASTGSNFIASPSDILTIDNANQSSIDCASGNWSTIYAQYESPLNVQLNSSLGQQYLNDPQFVAFLWQYLNMSDPYVNATVTQLFTGDESSLIQQQLPANSLQC
jgi:hypothetical protein